jgi:pimeloyl-ACP methyl ester carboxylesterase
VDRGLSRLADYWRDGYSWREHERRLNELPHFLTEIDGAALHFAHSRSSQRHATPILLLHCWPSTFADFASIAPLLSEPIAHGVTNEPAFDVVMPSLPGFAFSGATHDPGWNVDRIARSLAALMRQLGYPRYLVQGGGWASLIGPAIAAHDPDGVIGIHINAMINGSNVNWNDPDPTGGLTPPEILAVKEVNDEWHHRSGYAKMQSTRPQTLTYPLNDSPVGLLAWILDLEWAVSDTALPGETTAHPDDILTVASIFWFTRTIGSSMRLYKDHGDWLSAVAYNPTPAHRRRRLPGRQDLAHACRATPQRHQVHRIPAWRLVCRAPGSRPLSRRSTQVC